MPRIRTLEYLIQERGSGDLAFPISVGVGVGIRFDQDFEFRASDFTRQGRKVRTCWPGLDVAACRRRLLKRHFELRISQITLRIGCRLPAALKSIPNPQSPIREIPRLPAVIVFHMLEAYATWNHMLEAYATV